MSHTLSIRIDSATGAEEWQLGEIEAGIAELDAGKTISHEKVSKWLSSWDNPSELKAPRP